MLKELSYAYAATVTSDRSLKNIDLGASCGFLFKVGHLGSKSTEYLALCKICEFVIHSLELCNLFIEASTREGVKLGSVVNDICAKSVIDSFLICFGNICVRHTGSICFNNIFKTGFARFGCNIVPSYPVFYFIYSDFYGLAQVLPLFRWLYRGRLVVNIDGLEHRREKWGRLAKWFLRLSEACAVRAADVVVADNKGIADYVTETYGRESVTIAYGGDHAVREVPQERQQEMLAARRLTPGGYALSLCRIEPENNCHVILEAARLSGQKLVFVGNWNRSEYGSKLKADFAEDDNICLVDAVYNLDELYTLRRNCRVYIHGHSAGGTNPSLVEAMHCEVPILAYDVVYNRETTGQQAHYWGSAESLAGLLLQLPTENLQQNATTMKALARQHYCWSTIARRYEETYGR